jgi:hypothetical protein
MYVGRAAARRNRDGAAQGNYVGPRLRARYLDGLRIKAVIGMAVLNRMLGAGHPTFVRSVQKISYRSDTRLRSLLFLPMHQRR